MSAPAVKDGPLVVFDVETQNQFDEVGGRRNTAKLLLSVAVSYEEDSGAYRTFTEANVAELIDQLFGARLVVGYNLLGFDYRVLRPYTDRRLNALPTLDIFDHIYRRTGFRSKLDTITAETLGAHKSGHGLEALQWWREGKVDQVVEYCKEDVRLTYELYRVGKETGEIFTRDRQGRRLRVPIMW
jgi:DEAD/DEAH box helicase domain-containing protein